MENVVGMTALVGETVQRPFSGRGGELTGLPRVKANEAEGEDLADFGDAFSSRNLIDEWWIDHRDTSGELVADALGDRA